MSWFNPSESLPEDWEEILKEMAKSGDSAQASVAEYINDVADNFTADDSDAERREHLISCLNEMISSCLYLMNEMSRLGCSNNSGFQYGLRDLRDETKDTISLRLVFDNGQLSVYGPAISSERKDELVAVIEQLGRSYQICVYRRNVDEPSHIEWFAPEQPAVNSDIEDLENEGELKCQN